MRDEVINIHIREFGRFRQGHARGFEQRERVADPHFPLDHVRCLPRDNITGEIDSDWHDGSSNGVVYSARIEIDAADAGGMTPKVHLLDDGRGGEALEDAIAEQWGVPVAGVAGIEGLMTTTTLWSPTSAAARATHSGS